MIAPLPRDFDGIHVRKGGKPAKHVSNRNKRQTYSPHISVGSPVQNLLHLLWLNVVSSGRAMAQKHCFGRECGRYGIVIVRSFLKRWSVGSDRC